MDDSPKESYVPWKDRYGTALSYALLLIPLANLAWIYKEAGWFSALMPLFVGNFVSLPAVMIGFTLHPEKNRWIYGCAALAIFVIGFFVFVVNPIHDT